ncbi:hypothetical protein B0H13DRAFT_2101874 [Mycena leptocephala]|nr:hypothetical protein B0H13DRAFT_2101874 [Mycena leptocephala]
MLVVLSRFPYPAADGSRGIEGEGSEAEAEAEAEAATWMQLVLGCAREGDGWSAEVGRAGGQWVGQAGCTTRDCSVASPYRRRGTALATDGEREAVWIKGRAKGTVRGRSMGRGAGAERSWGWCAQSRRGRALRTPGVLVRGLCARARTQVNAGDAGARTGGGARCSPCSSEGQARAMEGERERRACAGVGSTVRGAHGHGGAMSSG